MRKVPDLNACSPEKLRSLAAAFDGEQLLADLDTPEAYEAFLRSLSDVNSA